MVWSQFSIKILGVHFGSFVLDNSNWDKISQSLAKKINIWKSATHFEMKKNNCKSNSLIQTLIYRSNIYYSKIYHKGTQLISLFGNVAGNNLEEISVQQLDADLPRDSFSKSYFALKMPKTFFKGGTLVPVPAIYQTKQQVLVLLFFGRFPMIQIIPCVDQVFQTQILN